MSFVTSSVTLDGKKVEVREFSARHRMILFDLHKEKLNPIMVQAHIVKMGCPNYSESEADDILDVLTGNDLDELSKEILDISGLGEGSEKKAKKK